MKAISKTFVTNSSSVVTVVTIDDGDITKSLEDWLKDPRVFDLVEEIQNVIPQIEEKCKQFESAKETDFRAGGYIRNDMLAPWQFCIAQAFIRYCADDMRDLIETFVQMITELIQKKYPEFEVNHGSYEV